MKRQPLISCIIIFLNAGKVYFEEAIESIFSQSYDNWELLLVDDGSTDESTEVAKVCARQCPEKVRYLEHEGHQNRGMSATRNLGIRHARGEYITFLDADDVWLPEKLEKYLNILESQPEAAMVCGATQFWFSWTGKPEDSQRDYVGLIGEGIQLNKLYKPPTLLTLFLRNEIDTPCTCSVLIRREVFEEIGLFEESFRGMYEDRVFFSKVYLKAPVFVIGEYWERYRRHSEAAYYVAIKTGQYNPYKPNPSDLIFLTWLKEYLSKESFQDTDVWQALQNRLWPYQHQFLSTLKAFKSKWKRDSIQRIKSFGKKVLPSQFRFQLDNFIRSLIVRNSIRQISELDKNSDCKKTTVLCIVRNGELYVQNFIEHYLSLGTEQIVLLDNGSIDNTVAIARKYKNVAILQTNYRNPKYQSLLTRYLVENFAQNRSYLLVEINELLEPLLLQSEQLKLS